MENSKQFIKLPVKGQNILTAFKTNGDRGELFKSITENLETQRTISSRQVRVSISRGLLRKYFELTDEDMSAIEPTADEKQKYNDRLVEGYKNQHENLISQTLIQDIMDTSDVMKLMIRSGLRIGELLDNPMKIVRGNVYFELNKKLDSKYYKIHIIGKKKEWVDEYREMKKTYKNVSLKTISDRINLKLKNIIPEGFYKRSTHISRAICVQYINKFKDNKLTLPQVITQYLHHENPSASVHYQHTVLDKDMPDFLNGKEDEIEEKIDVIEIPPNDKTKRDGQTEMRMKTTIDALKANDIKITTKVLKSYGYSSGSVVEFMAKLK
jgi:hypothetical protein